MFWCSMTFLKAIMKLTPVDVLCVTSYEKLWERDLRHKRLGTTALGYVLLVAVSAWMVSVMDIFWLILTI